MRESIRNGHYYFPNKKKSNISQGAKDLIKEMLDIDPETRIDIDDVLNHPWLLVNIFVFCYNHMYS